MNLFSISGSRIVITIPTTAVAVHPITTFSINSECKIFALAIIMQTKKEDRRPIFIFLFVYLRKPLSTHAVYKPSFADAKILKYIPQYLIRCDLARDFPEVVQAFPDVLGYEFPA